MRLNVDIDFNARYLCQLGSGDIYNVYINRLNHRELNRYFEGVIPSEQIH